MTPLNELAKRLTEALPEAYIVFDEPIKKGAFGFLDIGFNGNALSVQWAETKGFGVSTPEDHGYGMGADEVYMSVDENCGANGTLLKNGARTEPPPEVTLRELRAERNMTEVSLAHLLTITQPAVSKLESRVVRMSVSTHKTIVTAMGGRLVIQAQFPDGSVRRIATEDEDKNAAPVPDAVSAGS